ncbi:hypothetical protein CAI16_19320 [Virgibacillus dokdonensis]|uniref:Probable multidrug resistance protein NorM n=1 Tax=Virgibacillus dokdonensis TaxID=302167 RepID=A0A3E0WIK7_9BACI|nr:MATE family efflux transporter [Virgibacillus dokdonensis]RFA31981.1 hypothetical protein CAI16_19320 [Virgibacillus dokdonensis]
MQAINNFKRSNYYQILALSLPICISSTINIILGITDTILIGRTDVEQLAAVSSGAAVFSLLSAVISASLVSNGILSAKNFGAKNYQAAYESLIYTLIFGFALAFITIIIFSIFGTYLFDVLIKDEKAVQDLAFYYLLARFPGLLFLIPYSLIRDTLSSYKKTKWIIYATFITGISNVFYNYLFIFGFGFFPELGAIGAGIGSSLAILTGMLVSTYVFRKENIFKTVKIKELKFRRADFWSVQKLNYPPIGSAIFDYIVNLIIFGMLGFLGTFYLAGGRIAFQLDMFIFTIAMSLGVGSKILIGRAWGENDTQKIKSYFFASVKILLICLGIISLPFILFPSIILLIFTNIDEVINVTTGALVIIGLTFPFIALSSAIAGALRALGKTAYDMYANILPIWLIQLPISYILGIYYNLNLNGIYIGFMGYWIGRTVLSAIYLYKTLKELDRNSITQVEGDIKNG